MRFHSFQLLSFLTLRLAIAQGTVPTFEYSVGQAKYVFMGGDPAQGGTTTLTCNACAGHTRI
jgi:hypothetical protein